jgi:hypothetical protein
MKYTIVLIGGFVLGWLFNVALTKFRTRCYKREIRLLGISNAKLRASLEYSDRMYVKVSKSFLELRKKYDKGYRNKF